MCGIGQIEISVRVNAVTRNHGSCSIQVILLFLDRIFPRGVAAHKNAPARGFAARYQPKSNSALWSCKRRLVSLCIFYRYPARVLEISPFALKKPATATASLSGASFSLRIKRKTRVTLECKGSRKGENWKAVFFIERDVWVLGSTCSASYDPASIQANVLPLNVPKESLLGGVTTEVFRVIFLQFLSLWDTGNWPLKRWWPLKRKK